MLTTIRSLAHIPTAVRHVITIVLRILHFAAETVIIVRHLLADILASATTPSFLRLGAGRPRDDALQMDNVITILTRPSRLERFYHFTANQTFQFASVDFTNQLLALRTIACIEFRWSWLEISI